MKRLFSIPLVMDFIIGTWIAGFFVANLQKQGNGYFNPLDKMFSSSGHGFWGLVANIIAAIPQMSNFLLLIAFSYMAAATWASDRKGKLWGTVLMLAVHLGLSYKLTVQYILAQQDWVVHFFGPALGVGVAFLLYLGSQGALSLSYNSLFIFAASWEAGYVINGVTSQGAGYFQPLINVGHHFSLSSVFLAVAGMGSFFLFGIFSGLSVEKEGFKARSLGTLGMMGMHLLFASVPALLITGILNWLPHQIGEFITGSLGLILFGWGMVKRTNG